MMTEGEDHKKGKSQLVKEYQEKGYAVNTEYILPNDMVVDVIAEKGEDRVAIEIGTLRGKNREEELLEYVDKVHHITQLGKSQRDGRKAGVRMPKRW